MAGARSIVVEIIGDEKSYLRSVDRTLAANAKLESSSNTMAAELGRAYDKIGVDANLSADAQLKAAAKASEAMKAQALAMRAGVSRLPIEQQAAGTVAADAAMAKYQRSVGQAATSTRGFSSATKAGERDLGKMARGTLAGSGIVGDFGRSLAFASSGFLAFAAGATIVTRSIGAAEGLEKAQKSLAVAIQHTGGNLAQLEPRYTAIAKAAAQFGVSQTDATTGLARATVLAGNAAAAQRAYQEALVISKATGKDFNAVLTATAKGQEGVTTSLRRYGILVSKTSTGTEQFAKVMKRFGGQAAANTTQVERLHASLTDAMTTIGTALLPSVNKLAKSFADWLTKMNDSGQLQKDVTKGMRGMHDAATPLIASMRLLAHVTGNANSAWGAFSKTVGGKAVGFVAGAGVRGFSSALNDMFPGLGALTKLGSIPTSTSTQARAAGPIPAAGTESPNRIVGIIPPVPQKVLAQYSKSFNLRFGLLQAQAQAQLTKGLTDDVAVAKRIIADIKKKIDQGQLHGQALLQALSLEASAISTVQSAAAAAAQKQAAATQAAAARIQAQIQDSIDPLKTEVALSRAQALHKPILEALRKLRSAARDALASGKLSLDQQKTAWDQITSLNQQIADQLKKHKNKLNAAANAFKQASTRELTAGLDLTDAQRKALRARLSQLGPHGTVPGSGVGAFGEIIGPHGRPLVIHNHLHLSEAGSKEIARSTTRHQQRHRNRNSTQRRGPNAGVSGG